MYESYPRLGELVSLDTVRSRIAARHLDHKHHPEGHLAILDYSRTCQYDNAWDEATLLARGLIVTGGPLSSETRVVARPFPKFFTREQHDLLVAKQLVAPLPFHEPFEVLEKLDGSMGTAYFDEKGGTWNIATRGSFSSPQALWATEQLRSQYSHALDNLDPTKTYVFEIIYPENRIVVQYEFSDLVLLAILDTATGRAEELPGAWPGRVVQRFDASELDTLTSDSRENFEGYVVRFESGVRYKAKYDEYCRLHKLVTNTSTVNVWEHLAVGAAREAGMNEKQIVRNLGIDHRVVEQLYAVPGNLVERLIDGTPDEFDVWIAEQVSELTEKANAWIARWNEAYASVPEGLTPKEFALYVQEHFGDEDRHQLMGLRTGRAVVAEAWKRVRPTFSKAWARDDDA